jgi:hypothetical protein
VRRVRVAVEVFLEPFDLAEVDDTEAVDSEEVFEDIEVSGGLEERVVAVRREFEKIPGASAGRIGEDSVKSSSSISACDGRSSDGVGTGAACMTGPTFRNFVGVTDARHVSSVVCLVLPGDGATEVPRGSLVIGRVLAFFAGNCEGEGCAGELSKSKVSMMSSNGGVDGRSDLAPMFAGSVCDRCIGCLFLLFVTLDGRSSKTGGSAFSRVAPRVGAVLLDITGDEESRSMTFDKG